MLSYSFPLTPIPLTLNVASPHCSYYTASIKLPFAAITHHVYYPTQYDVQLL